jgi:hypothetical protein
MTSHRHIEITRVISTAVSTATAADGHSVFEERPAPLMASRFT